MVLLVYCPVVEGLVGVFNGVEEAARGEVGSIHIHCELGVGLVYGLVLLLLEKVGELC